MYELVGFNKKRKRQERRRGRESEALKSLDRKLKTMEKASQWCYMEVEVKMVESLKD